MLFAWLFKIIGNSSDHKIIVVCLAELQTKSIRLPPVIFFVDGNAMLNISSSREVYL